LLLIFIKLIQINQQILVTFASLFIRLNQFCNFLLLLIILHIIFIIIALYHDLLLIIFKVLTLIFLLLLQHVLLLNKLLKLAHLFRIQSESHFLCSSNQIGVDRCVVNLIVIFIFNFLISIFPDNLLDFAVFLLAVFTARSDLFDCIIYIVVVLLFQIDTVVSIIITLSDTASTLPT